MSPVKLAWLIWCIMWAFFWMTIGWILLPLNIMFFMASVVMMIPSLTGNHRRPARPVAPFYPTPPTPIERRPRGIDGGP